MKLGIIMQPESGCFERAKELGLDFVEFDCNPVEYFGRPVEELWNSRETLKEESRRTGVEAVSYTHLRAAYKAYAPAAG